ncbi:flagellar FliJ family protein [Microbacterium sp. ASV81]|uniref:Flagellar FliJ protein n=1 Tax=Microbacterium capsulatum TaxID=3041921 RepID=A0ABU0XHL1_9MICO|nr:flagellar FliJ family protein [Microbacterium sp. ASV81]MDQ4213200.1 flagellar FliJ family protein [Microbacterium sp. ASV81]
MTFSLAGLLRVRSAQERAAAEQLSQASADVARAEAAERSVADGLTGIGAEAGDGAALMAIAAARAAGRSMLGDLQTLTELLRGEEETARAAHVEARRDLKGLERMEAAYTTSAAKAELDAEQRALDEVAGLRAARAEGSAA